MSEIENDNIIGSGAGQCDGGTQPDPPIDGYPLLIWTGKVVKTEDGRATVPELALAYPEHPSVQSLARRFQTTPEHVSQAIIYANNSGLLK